MMAPLHSNCISTCSTGGTACAVSIPSGARLENVNIGSPTVLTINFQCTNTFEVRYSLYLLVLRTTESVCRPTRGVSVLSNLKPVLFRHNLKTVTDLISLGSMARNKFLILLFPYSMRLCT